MTGAAICARMDEVVGGLLSKPARPPQRARQHGRVLRGRREWEEQMDKRGPIDRPFLVFVVIVTIAVVALGIALYPRP